jgi:NAD(P)-dependent dehydrogenase (short-subunit alcohol dehydrogenase family)
VTAARDDPRTGSLAAGAAGGGKVVVVTGGTRGIGRGLVEAFLDRSCAVAFCGRSAASVDGALADLHGRAVVGVAAEVADEAGMTALWDEAVEAFGRVDVWINNAGVSAPRLPLHELPLARAREVVETNLTGTITASAVALRGLLGQDGGQLWNMEGFGSGGQMVAGMATYGASKRAVTYFTRALLKDTKGTGVQVGLLSPGIVVTDLLLGDYEGRPAELAKAKKIFNILGDRVETVAPWLADQVLATTRTGAHVQWLTKPKVVGRFAGAVVRKRDVFGAAA